MNEALQTGLPAPGKIEEMKSAYKAATPGEWHVETSRSGCLAKVRCDKGYAVVEGYFSPSAKIKYKDLWAEAEGNAKLAALAHNLMPELLRAVVLLRSLAGMETETEINERTDDEGMSGDDAVEILSGVIMIARDILEDMK